MNAMRKIGRGGWQVSDIESAAFADELLAWQQGTDSSWADIVVASGRKHSSQGWLRDIANGYSHARSGTITEFRALMAQYPKGIPAGGIAVLVQKPVATPPVSAADMARFARQLTGYVRSNCISFSDLARICGYERRCGPWLQGLAEGTTRAKAETILRIRRAINANPNAQGVVTVAEGRPKGSARIAAETALQGDAPYVPPHIAKQIEIERMRDAAAANRAAWIETQRQAEIAKYGRTTIDRDVAECLA